nr:hypothetical protein [Pseudomonas chengduensis]
MEEKSPSNDDLSLEARASSMDLSYILLFVGVILFFAYAWFIGGAYISKKEPYIDIKTEISGAEPLVVGVPISAVAAYIIVTMLLHSFPPSKDQSGQISFKVIGLEFSGPAGPVTLWLACFLAFVGAISTLS